VRSGPGAARTILLFHIISASPSKQPRMVGSTLGAYFVGLIFVSAEQIKDIIIKSVKIFIFYLLWRVPSLNRYMALS
jgi:hypothetical protein